MIQWLKKVFSSPQTNEQPAPQATAASVTGLDERKLGAYYERIANQLDGMAPDNWYKIALRAEDLGDVQLVSFFFQPDENSEYIHSGKMPDLYGIDLDAYFDALGVLQKTVRQLRNEFIEQGLPPWYVFSFFLEQDFTFKAEYEYLDAFDENAGPTTKETYWAYKKLNLIPTSAFKKQLLEEYMATKGETLP